MNWLPAGLPHALIVLLPAIVGNPFVVAEERDLNTISLTLKLRTGGQLSGAVLDHDENAIVILSQNTPYVFSWSELDPGAALATKRTLLARERGGADRLSVDDHFQLGMFVLRNGRNDLASNEFDLARRLDPKMAPQINDAFAQFRKEAESWRTSQGEDLKISPEPGAHEDTDNDAEKVQAGPNFERLPPPSSPAREDIREVYLRFGEKVRDVMGTDIRLVESDHFLIWTDWGPKQQAQLTKWCESMYAALCIQFGLDAKNDVFLAKCPVFCFRSKARFRRFARDFDGYDAKNAIGYTRSIESNGHVHMAFARMGSTPSDYDRFACTLVHEGTHAFLHRLFGTHLLPHWINEGYAELTAERVLGDRCPAGENAALLAKQYARFDWPVTPFLARLSTIEIHEYPLACSIVTYLDSQKPQAFVTLIKSLKQGTDLPTAMSSSFDGLTIERLDRDWKQSNRCSTPGCSKNTNGSGRAFADHKGGQ